MKGETAIRMLVPCPTCFRFLSNPFAELALGKAALATNNRVQCPNCKTLVLMPDSFGDPENPVFVATTDFVTQFRTLAPPVILELYRMVREQSPDATVEAIRRDERYKELREWIPNTPSRINAYCELLRNLAIAYLSLKLACTSAELTDQILLERHDYVAQQRHDGKLSDEMCPCGSGRTFDQCHGAPQPTMPNACRPGDAVQSMSHCQLKVFWRLVVFTRYPALRSLATSFVSAAWFR